MRGHAQLHPIPGVFTCTIRSPGSASSYSSVFPLAAVTSLLFRRPYGYWGSSVLTDSHGASAPAYRYATIHAVRLLGIFYYISGNKKMNLKLREPDFCRAFAAAGAFSGIVGFHDRAIIEISAGLELQDPGSFTVNDIYTQIMLSIALV